MSEFEKDLKKIIITSLIFVILGISIDIFYNVCNYNIFAYACNIKNALFSIFFIGLIFLAFWAITKKTWKAFLSVSIVILIITFINQLKIIYTDEPLNFTDIYFLSNTSELINIVDESLITSIKLFIPQILVYIVFIIICCIISYYNNITISKKKIRIIMFVIPIVIFIFLFLPNKFINTNVLNIVFDANKRKDYSRAASEKEEILINGVISGMYQHLLENRLFEPENYDEEIVEKNLYNISNIEDNSFGTPNIIVLFAESFWDIDLLDEIQFDKKITANFTELKKSGIFFDMITPSYGGTSANVEFEFLTGANMMYFPEGYIPTMRLYNNDSYNTTPSIIRELKNNGYKTKIVNYTGETFFNISNFYKRIQMDEVEFNTRIDPKHIKGNYVSDEYVVDKIIQEFNNKPENEKLFYMTLSMQSHMTYQLDKYDNYDIKIEKSSYSKEINETLLSYAQGIYDMDLQLKRLYDYIQNLEEPTLVVFFGDHLPYLKTSKGENILEHLEYFNTNDELLNTYRQYNTQALILSNYELGNEEKEYLSPNLLGTYILNKMDIDISPYYRWLNNYIDIMPSANWYVTMDNNRKLYHTDKLEGFLKEQYHLREYIQYHHFLKK